MQSKEDPTPFGKEWKKQLMRHNKKELVHLLEKVCRENIEYQFEIRNLKRALF